MCYQKFHRCKYCKTDYLCALTNIECPSVNDDRDANLCNLCRNRLEEILREDEELIVIPMEDLLEGDEDEN